MSLIHGFPLRAMLPDQVGNLWVKWLLEIVVQ
jgi:DMSO/TMAO reductase YedYZ molybdopterin-dependent catalytic subunit